MQPPVRCRFCQPAYLAAEGIAVTLRWWPEEVMTVLGSRQPVDYRDDELDRVMGRIAARFARVETRRHARTMLGAMAPATANWNSGRLMPPTSPTMWNVK